MVLTAEIEWKLKTLLLVEMTVLLFMSTLFFLGEVLQ